MYYFLTRAVNVDFVVVSRHFPVVFHPTTLRLWDGKKNCMSNACMCARARMCVSVYTRGLRFCPIESCRCIDSRASAICLYIKIDMRLKFDGTESKTADVRLWQDWQAVSFQPLDRIQLSNSHYIRFILRINRLEKILAFLLFWAFLVHFPYFFFFNLWFFCFSNI